MDYWYNGIQIVKIMKRKTNLIFLFKRFSEKKYICKMYKLKNESFFLIKCEKKIVPLSLKCCLKLMDIQ